MITKHEIRDGMRIDWNEKVVMDDGIVLYCDVFRPVDESKVYPAILTYGPYAKGLPWKVGYVSAWKQMMECFPETAVGTTTKYMNWETCDPEKWVPDGYACIRFDSRGAGCSNGVMSPQSSREIKDICNCIEWAGTQPWCNGNVGMLGISYYGANQWATAAQNPPHLKAIVPWEAFSDKYRDMCWHGGIYSSFLDDCTKNQISYVQHGWGEKGGRNPVTGDLITGDELLDPEVIMNENTSDFVPATADHEFGNDPFWEDVRPNLKNVKVPVLDCANWGGAGIHLRGNMYAFDNISSEEKYLEVHGDTHWSHFYTNYGLKLQKQFLGYYLKGEANGWDKHPKVQLNIRHPGEKFVLRYEDEWPLARTQYTKFYLTPDCKLSRDIPAGKAQLTYRGFDDGLTFLSDPLEEPLEITGFLRAQLTISADTQDADIFLVFRAFDPSMHEITFIGASDPHTPLSLGWLRASHRKLDPEKSTDYRPFHAHDEKWPLTPGEPVDLDVEILPTCIVLPKGYRFALSVRGKDYEYTKDVNAFASASNFSQKLNGCGPNQHHSKDRPAEVFDNNVTLYFDENKAPYVVLPIIPEKE